MALTIAITSLDSRKFVHSLQRPHDNAKSSSDYQRSECSPLLLPPLPPYICCAEHPSTL